ncbi:serine/threonine-protein kinase 36 isoform X2 [Electrophorus electricus]|uniref:serine/threonine-protein kinase 36 isoform X2 n=1 Tax=Electrophorus electricus TaxID=8005 RepID=UPI0015D0219F|nr:serine/threonine-protein kinase 36 isoform X2 [Electrophorus electricus]
MMEQYHVLEMIGEGSFGRVYKGRRKFSGQVVALKFIPKVGRTEKELRSLKREIDIMRGLKHPNIVLLLDSFETEREVVVVTEYAEGELFQILEDDGCLPESQVREIACQLVSALYYLHSHRILHRDMKPQNILLGKGGVVKLCDFGFARAMSVSTLVLTSIKGTPLYMSPELVEEKPYDHTADLWSLGCILYELHTGAPPFYTNSIFQLVQLIVKDSVKWPENMSQACMSFLKGLLTKDPQKRLAWPALLHHPYVADGVIVLSDEGSSSPLTVTPSPDLQALKRLQAAKKSAPHSGESKLLRRAREQWAKEQKSRQAHAENGKAVCSSQPRSRTAPAGEAPTGGRSLGSTFTVCQNSAHAPANQHQASDIGVARVNSAPCKGPISRDYEREFPSVEVGPRLERDADSDEEWKRLAEVTDWANHTSASMDPPIHQKLKNKLLRCKDQVLGGTLEEPSVILHPVTVLTNMILTSGATDSRRVVEVVGLPHILFNLLEEMLSSPELMKRPWHERVLGQMMVSLLTFWKNNPDWNIKEKSIENLCQLFMSVLLRSDPNPLAPLVATVLSQLVDHGARVCVRTHTLTALLESLLSGPEEVYHPFPAGWGICDGVLALVLRLLSESERSALPGFLNSKLWCHLWTKVGNMLQNTVSKTNFLSVNGLRDLLSLALLAFCDEPYDCVTLFFTASNNLGCTLSRLLTADSSAELERGLQWGCSGVSSLSAMSCHLFCFPFALPLPPEKMAEVLSSYQSLNLVTSLVQVIQSQPLPLLELPLWLLRRLCLSSPQWAISSFFIAARASGFLPPSAEARQMLNLLNQPRSTAEQPVCRGIPHKGQADLARGTRNQENRSAAMVPGSVDKARAVGEAVRVQAQVPKHQAGRWREQGDRWKVKTDLQIPRAEHLQHSTESYSGSVEELLDSLELHEDFIDLKYLAAQRNSTMSWLVDSLEQPGNDRNCVRGDGRSLTISVVKGQSPEPKIRTVSSLLSDLLQIESLCGCTMQLLALLFQTIPDGSVLPVDPALLNLALGHHDDGVRATACELLTRLRPNLGHFPAGVETGPSLLRKLLSCLSDPAPSVRRSACRAAVKTLALIAHADLGPEVSEGNWCVQKGVMGGRRGTVGGPVRGSETRVVETEGEGLLEVVMGAASTALSLLSDSDAVIRRHSCVVLGTMAVIDGCGLALISAGAPRQLQHVARGDSHHAVRRQAESALHAFSQQDTLQQALKSMDAELKLHHGSPSSSLPSNYKALVRQQDRPNRGKHNVDSTPGSNV